MFIAAMLLQAATVDPLLEEWKACAISASARLVEDGARWSTAAYGALGQCKEHERAFAGAGRKSVAQVETAKALVTLAMQAADSRRSIRDLEGGSSRR